MPLSDGHAFPRVHYPHPTPLNKDGAQMADSYGSYQAADLATDWPLQSSDSPRRFVFQYHHGNEAVTLKAEEPTLPLFRPQAVSPISLPGVRDVARFVRVEHWKIQDRILDQASYFYSKYPDLIWGSALDFLKDSYVDRGCKRSLKHDPLNPVVKLGKVTKSHRRQELEDFLEPVAYDIQPNMLLNLLRADLDETIHKQYLDQDLYGGCLAYQPLKPDSHHEGLLVFPTGPTLESLNIHALPHQGVPVYSIRTSPSLHFALTSPLRQVETVSFPYRDTVLAGLRTDYTCCVIRLNPKKDKVKATVGNVVRSLQKTASVALSPYLYGECLLGLSTGGIQVIRPDREPECIQPTPELSRQSPRWCHYAAHPKQVICLQRNSLDLIDCRVPVEGRVDSALLSLPCDLVPSDQVLFVAKQHPSNPFYHFAATQSLLILLDERFPKYNVLKWSHALDTPPSYMDVVPRALTSDDLTSDLVTLGTQCSREVHCFQCSTLNGQTPVSTSLPWKVASTDGWFDLLPEYPATNLDPVRSRLKSPLIGVSAAKRTPRQGCEPGVTIFQLSSEGDVYFQPFGRKTGGDGADKTLSAGPGCPEVKLSQGSLANCKEWIEGALQEDSRAPRLSTPTGSVRADDARTKEIISWMVSKDDSENDCQLCLKSSQSRRRRHRRSRPRPTGPAPLMGDAQFQEWLAGGGQILSKELGRGAGDREEADGNGDGDGEALPWRVDPGAFRGEISRALHHVWVHGYDSEAEGQDELDNSLDQNFTPRPVSPPRSTHTDRTPELFSPSQRKRPLNREPVAPRASQHLDLTGQLGAADTPQLSSLSLSQKSRRAKVRRSTMGF